MNRNRLKKLYGPEVEKSGFVRAQLFAGTTPLIERGVRFVQVFHRGWDHHSTATR